MLKDSLQRKKLGKNGSFWDSNPQPIDYKPSAQPLSYNHSANIDSTDHPRIFCRNKNNEPDASFCFRGNRSARRGKNELRKPRAASTEHRMSIKASLCPFKPFKTEAKLAPKLFHRLQQKINRQSEHLPGLGECCHGPGRKVAGSNLATIYPQNIRPRI